jgi:hypothetical protein
MTARNIPADKGPPARNADNFTAICEPINWEMLQPLPLTTLWAPTDFYGNNFAFNNKVIHFMVNFNF